MKDVTTSLLSQALDLWNLIVCEDANIYGYTERPRAPLLYLYNISKKIMKRIDRSQ
jgi:hypothetical protein